MSALPHPRVSFVSVILLGLAAAGSALIAQETLALPQLHVPYRCSDGTAYIVQYCNPGRQATMCYLHVEKNGMLIGQPFEPLSKMTDTWMKTCPVKASESQPFTSSYVREMPAVDRVKREVQGANPTDTVARQLSALKLLEQLIYRMLGPYRDRNTLTPEEKEVINSYVAGAAEISRSFAQAHSPDEAKALTQLKARYDTSATLVQELNDKLLSPGIRAELAKVNAAFESQRQTAVAAARREAEAEKAQPAQGSGAGSPFVRNDPGTLAARRCVELGGSELECIGKGLTTGVAGLFGGVPSPVAGKTTRAGLTMTGQYAEGKTVGLMFGDDAVALTGCGNLVQNSHSYTVERKTSRFTVNVSSQPTPFVLSLGPDGRLAGPGPTDVKGQIITGYRRVWMQEYHNGIAVSGGGYFADEPIFAAKTERCIIGTFAPTGPTGDGGVLSTLTALVAPQTLDQTPTESGKGQAAPGVRMRGQYARQGGIALEFRDNGVIMDCGEAHAAKPYTVQPGATQVVITVNNDPAPFTLALQSDGSLTGSGTVDVMGRVVTGSTANGIAFAPKNARCSVGVLTPKR